MQDTQVQWKAKEYNQQNHTIDWYWVVGAFSLAFVALAIIFGNVLLAVLIVVAGISLILQALKKPPVVTFAVSDTGIRVGALLYRYKDLDSFSVSEENILIKSKKLLMPYIVIPVPHKHQENVYVTLSTYLPEEEYTESAIEKMMEEFGF